MYWVDEIVDSNPTNPLIKIKYYWINPETAIIEIHEKIVQNEDQFKIFYYQSKSL